MRKRDTTQTTRQMFSFVYGHELENILPPGFDTQYFLRKIQTLGKLIGEENPGVDVMSKEIPLGEKSQELFDEVDAWLATQGGELKNWRDYPLPPELPSEKQNP